MRSKSDWSPVASSLHLDRAARGHRHYRRSGRAHHAGRSVRARIGEPCEVPEQLEAARAGGAGIPRRVQRVSRGLVLHDADV